MKVSSRGEYGLRALIDLAAHWGQGPVPSAAIAERQSIPPNYLNQLLISLRDAELIHSARGPGGGHTLARPPEQITLRMALDVLEGRPAAGSCPTGWHREGCEREADCQFRGVWEEIRVTTEHILDTRTLRDLIPETISRPD